MDSKTDNNKPRTLKMISMFEQIPKSGWDLIIVIN